MTDLITVPSTQPDALPAGSTQPIVPPMVAPAFALPVVPPEFAAGAIAQHRFGSSFRGYDADEVRTFLLRLSSHVKGLHEQVDGLRVELTAARSARLVVDLTTPPVGQTVEPSEQDVAAKLVVETAQAEAKTALEAARAEAQLILGRAQEEAGRIMLRARAESRGKQAEVRGVSDSEASPSASQAGTSVATVGVAALAAGSGEAVFDVPNDPDAARAQARAMIQEARAVRERILTDLAKRRRTAHVQLEQLRVAREKLQETLREARRVIDASSRDVSHAEVEARLAAEAAGRRVSAEPIPTAEQLEIEVMGGRHLHLFQPADLPPATDDGVVDLTADLTADVTADLIDEDAIEVELIVAESAVLPEDSAVIDELVVEELVVEELVVEELVVEELVVEELVVEELVVDELVVDELVVEELVVEVLVMEELDVDPATVEVADCVGVESPPQDTAEVVGTPEVVEADPTEMATNTQSDDLGEPDMASAVIPELSVSSTASAAVSVPSTTATPTEPLVRRRKMDDVFARIRADREVSTQQAREVLQSSSQRSSGTSALAPDLSYAPVELGLLVIDEPIETAEPSSAAETTEPSKLSDADAADRDSSILERRNSDMELLLLRVSKQLKRHLQDEHSAALTAVRRTRGRLSVDAVLGTVDEQHGRATAVLNPGLEEAAQAGARSAEAFEAPSTGVVVSVAGLVQLMANDVLQPIREALSEALEQQHSDIAALLGQAFREWNTDRLGRRVRDGLSSAFASGLVGAVAQGVPMHWLVDHGDEPSPECDDNALEGTVANGDLFPTGHSVPPLGPGCRCLVVPRP